MVNAETCSFINRKFSLQTLEFYALYNIDTDIRPWNDFLITIYL